jgi:hypothetical protein
MVLKIIGVEEIVMRTLMLQSFSSSGTLAEAAFKLREILLIWLSSS